MRRIDAADYRDLLAQGVVIERDGHGEKLLALPSGVYVKIFRRKKWLSTALFLPYARRFVRNAERLAGLGVATVTVVATTYCPAVRRHLVTYHPLPGVTLRDKLRDDVLNREAVLARVAPFIAHLHQNGIYFRSLHFGNIIVAPDGLSLGLIDVADMAIGRGPLGVRQRIRNARHLLRYAEDENYLRVFGYDRFAALYLAGARLDDGSQGLFTQFWSERQG